MSYRAGLVGLPNAGKSTIFNALTAGRAEVADYPFTTINPNIGIVPVPDARLAALAARLHPPKVTPATLEVVDIAGLLAGAHQGEGLGNQFLAQIRDVDLVILVLRAFTAGQVPHVRAEVDPLEDLTTIETELLLADLEIVHRQLAKLDRVAKAGDKKAQEKVACWQRLAAELDQGRRPDLRGWTAAAQEQAAELPLLTTKPYLLVANVDEEEWQARRLLPALEAEAAARQVPLVPILGQLEAELQDLPPEERREFLAAVGLESSGLDRLLTASYQLLGLITFYTIVGAEMRAWTVPAGTPAARCAGRIHTDMERGFIKVEVMAAADLIRLGSVARVKEAGLWHIEGRDYLVQDGDILYFRFQVR